MYDTLSYGTLAPIAERLAREIFAMTGLNETLVTHEYDYSTLAGIAVREIELLMSAEFLTLRNSENHRERQREAEARETGIRTACGQVLPDDFIGCLCDVCDEALQREVSERNALPLAEKLGLRDDPTDESQAQLLAMTREARQVNALSERPSVNAPEGAWCTKCVRFHTLWGCDDLGCVYCYEGGHQTLHIPTGMSA
jgi:hypothetical protein